MSRSREIAAEPAEPEPDLEAYGQPEPWRGHATATPASDELEPYTRDVPGVVGEIIEWIVATARRPNRVLALAAAIPLVGTLIGRRVAGPTGQPPISMLLRLPLPEPGSNTRSTASTR